MLTTPRNFKSLRHRLLLALLLSAGASYATPALAQAPSGNVGRALDNNLQVGSGGVNQAAEQPDFRARNDIITGNVSGLGYFRGRTGYAAPGEFRGSTAEDRLFRFNAQSLPQSGDPYNPGYGQLNAGQPLSVYRPAAATSAGDVRQSLGSGNILIRPADPNYRVGDQWVQPRQNQSQLETPGAAGSTSVVNPGLLPGATQQPSGQALQLTATPLLGVRSPRPDDPRQNTPGQNAASSLELLGLPAGGPTEGGTPSPDAPAEDASRSSFRINNRVDPLSQQVARQPGLVVAPPVGGVYSSDGSQSFGASPRWSPAAELGLQLQARIDPGRIDQATTLDQRIDQLQARMFSPLGNRNVTPGQDAYLDMLQRIQQNQRQAAGGTQNTNAPNQLTPTPGTPGIPGTPGTNAENTNLNLAVPGATGANTTAAPATITIPPPVLVAPSPEQVVKAQAERRVQRVARGLPVEDAPATDANAKPAQPQNPAATNKPAPNRAAGPSSEATNQRRAKVDELVAALDHRLPPVNSLAPANESAVANLMRGAEEDLAAGRYFNAEDRYRNVLALAPNTPLARVGLVHAQMGAGLTRSAAFTLRELLEQNPELIAARYEPRLLPSTDRIRNVQKEIDNLIATTSRAEPAILLAYLGYQYQMPSLIEYGLSIAETRAPADPLLPLLRRLWLKPVPSSAPTGRSPENNP